MYPTTGPWQCALFLIPRSFHDGGALNYSTAPHRERTTLISNGVFCLLESKILSIGQTLLYSLALRNISCRVRKKPVHDSTLGVWQAVNLGQHVLVCIGIHSL
jgi:hypothetical protein